jgi:acetyltransferase-like isoleucine patch superfamily enzyme
METFYSREELQQLGIRRLGEHVLIGRHAILYSPETLEIGDHVRIDDYTIISGRVVLHDFIHISHFCGLYGGRAGIEIMDFCGLSSKISIYALSDDYSGSSMTNPMIPAEFKTFSYAEPVTLGRHVLIGSGCVVLPGAEIGEGCSVGSMTLVTGPLATWGIC